MALLPLDIPPGVYRNGTQYQSKGRYYDSNLIRWVDKTLRPMGGWRAKTASTVSGKARSAIAWVDNSSLTWLGIGTHSKFYVMDRGGTVTDITPARASGTLGTNPIDTTNTDKTVTVTSTTHGLTVGDTVVLSGATDTGGLVINGEWVVATVPGANSFTFEHTSEASSTATGGGASVAYIYEISPGRGSSVSEGGYGDGNYGDGAYGTPRPDTTEVQPATVWVTDTFGQYINTVRDDHGTIYDWQLNVSNRLTAVANAPTASALVTTNEGFLLALGAGGNERKVQWCDQADNTLWTPAATNQAGSRLIETNGSLMCGIRVSGATLILTSRDAQLARYTADVNVFAFNQLADGCGAISRNAVAAIGDVAIWMGNGQFWIYNGFVQPMRCEVEDFIFSDMNQTQKAKIHCTVNSEFSEIIWWFVSDASTDVDKYVKYNINDNVWDVGTVSRTAAVDRGVFEYPIYIDGSGNILEHEVGWNYDSETPPFAEGGPLEIGNGDRFSRALRIIPDEKTSGDVTMTFKTRLYPNGTETSYGPYSAGTPTDVRFQARSFRIRYDTNVLGDWRVGSPRIEIIAGDKR